MHPILIIFTFLRGNLYHDLLLVAFGHMGTLTKAYAKEHLWQNQSTPAQSYSRRRSSCSRRRSSSSCSASPWSSLTWSLSVLNDSRLINKKTVEDRLNSLRVKTFSFGFHLEHVCLMMDECAVIFKFSITPVFSINVVFFYGFIVKLYVRCPLCSL